MISSSNRIDRYLQTIRAEILQDVRRLPDEPVFYHQEATQTLILDILFLWCKTHPECGGYRQGMHELLAPMVYAVHQDAVDRTAATEALADPTMVEMLDSYFVEHDSFALFSAVMQNAKVFYEVKSDSQSGSSLGSTPAVATTTTSTEQSAIVERSRQVHEVTLMKVDPELSTHLSSVDILPQIFLMCVLDIISIKSWLWISSWLTLKLFFFFFFCIDVGYAFSLGVNFPLSSSLFSGIPCLHLIQI